MLPFTLVAHPLFGLSDPTLGVDTARGVTTIRRIRRSVRQQRHGDPLTKSKRFGQPRCWSRAEVGAASEDARARTSSTDVTSSRNTESGIRFAYRIRFKDMARRESGILGSAVNEIIFAEQPGSYGENRNIRGTPSLSTGETLGPLVQLIELI